MPPPRSAKISIISGGAKAAASPLGERRAFCRRAPPPRRLAPGSNRPSASRSERGDTGARRARVRLRQDETRREGEVEALLFLLPRPRRELASVLAPTQRRAPPRGMAPPRGRRRDQPRASGERRSAATMRRECRYVPNLRISFRSLSPLLAATFMPPRGRPTLVVLSLVISSSVASFSSASSCGAAACRSSLVLAASFAFRRNSVLLAAPREHSPE